MLTVTQGGKGACSRACQTGGMIGTATSAHGLPQNPLGVHSRGMLVVEALTGSVVMPVAAGRQQSREGGHQGGAGSVHPLPL